MGPAARDRAYDALADHAGRYLDMALFDRLIGRQVPSAQTNIRTGEGAR
jgi:hypothetical protein